MEEKKVFNVFEKLQKCRVELQKTNLTKSGNNNFQNYDYFELKDFLPTINELFLEHGLFSIFVIKGEVATLTIYDTESDKNIVFETPTANATNGKQLEIQGLGSMHTYLKRYLYLNALEIIQNDTIDNKDQNKNSQAKKGSMTKPQDIERIIELLKGDIDKEEKILEFYGIENLKQLDPLQANTVISKLKKNKGEE